MTGNGVTVCMLSIKEIRRDGGTQARVQTNENLAKEYSEEMQAGATFPAPVVFHDGKDYWLADGWHTVRAHEIAGYGHITVSVREGSRRDAILYAVGANVSHGQRRSPGDLRKAICMLLEDAEWSKQPHTWVAKQCGCNEGTVRRVRTERKLEAEQARARESRNGFAEPAAEVAPADSQVTCEEREPTSDERMLQIEGLASRLRRLLGDAEDVRPALAILHRYLAFLRDAVGWEEEPEVKIDEQVLKAAKSLTDRMRKQHLEFPGSRKATQMLEHFLVTVKRAGGARNGSPVGTRTAAMT